MRLHWCAAVSICLLMLDQPCASVLRAQAAPPVQVPVVILSDGDTDPCDSVGAVAHLDPKGDNYLSVQSGPGGKPYTERDRLHTGQHVWICGDSGNAKWWAVVYGSSDDTDCKIARPKVKKYSYTGPCRYGWVAKRYVEIIAG